MSKKNCFFNPIKFKSKLDNIFTIFLHYGDMICCIKISDVDSLKFEFEF